jgi:hypothetical protein
MISTADTNVGPYHDIFIFIFSEDMRLFQVVADVSAGYKTHKDKGKGKVKFVPVLN